MTTQEVTVTQEREGKKSTGKRMNVRYMTVTAMLSALAFVLMFLDFSVPIMPSFIKMDLSELPALIGAFAMGPWYGVAICLVKNLLHLLITSTGGVGEVSNFMLGVFFVLPAGLIYRKKKTKKRAIIGATLGAFLMGVLSIFSNYFVVYPVYSAFMPTEVIISMYQAILPSIEDGNLLQCLIIFNAPYTFFKGMISVVITVLVYKRIAPIIKGVERK